MPAKTGEVDVKEEGKVRGEDVLKSSCCYPPWGLLSWPCAEDLGEVSGSHPPTLLSSTV